MIRRFTWLLAISALLIGGCSTERKNAAAGTSPTDVIEQTTEKGPVKLTIRLSPNRPRLSDLVELDIEVEHPIDVEVRTPAFGRSVGEFLIRDYSQKTSARGQEKPNVRHFYYQLEPVHTGPHLIRSIAIEFADHRADSESLGETTLIESNPIELEVTSELGDKVPNLADLSPMLPPRPMSHRFAWAWLWILPPLLIAAILLIWFRRKRKSEIVEAIPLSPSEIARQALAELLAENLPAQHRFQEFYLRLTGIVRHYIEGTTGIHAPELTTEEFLRTMHARSLFPEIQSVRLQEFLEAADMVKYAGQQPTSEQIELSTARAGEFVQLRSPPLMTTASSGGQV